jgi:hypothetical protein
MRLSSFAGAWALARDIEDVRAGRSGTLAGEARFTPAAEGLAYVETGTLAFPGTPPMQASRRHLWREGAAGGIDVLFEDGRFFHRFDPADPSPGALHDCGADRYRVRYDFSRWPEWRSEWRVSGPAKDYVLVSRFRRAAA